METKLQVKEPTPHQRDKPSVCYDAWIDLFAIFESS